MLCHKVAMRVRQEKGWLESPKSRKGGSKISSRARMEPRQRRLDDDGNGDEDGMKNAGDEGRRGSGGQCIYENERREAAKR